MQVHATAGEITEPVLGLPRAQCSRTTRQAGSRHGTDSRVQVEPPSLRETHRWSCAECGNLRQGASGRGRWASAHKGLKRGADGGEGWEGRKKARAKAWAVPRGGRKPLLSLKMGTSHL